ncbi:dimethylmenaquinone methyltransferase [Achlya hypogyna]|uniref:Dimethylmenaquinone methyltransferase n=1 Tax=Achlya hypogyna TaxID=1202772 RepID=A0A1V9ZGV7_ACHHY|nr:dimethylmenaquinone methyltransferase [Achlya hypogyna]
MDFATLSPTTLADVLHRNHVMRHNIRPLWACPRIAGPAYTVHLSPGDNLMLHAAMYDAPKGAVVVVQSGDMSFAAIGGNVARIAKERGIAGLVLDGLVRDIAEIRDLAFPVFARGIIPVPGTKVRRGLPNQPIVCGDVPVHPGDVVVADEEGIVVVPWRDQAAVFAAGSQRQEKEAREGFEGWKRSHRARIEAAMKPSV